MLESLARRDCPAQARYGIKPGAMPQTDPGPAWEMAAVVAATKRKTGRFSLFF
jgi:hypothetical protein